MTTIDMDSVEGFQLKHGSLIGGARKGCLCLSLRLAVLLQGLISVVLLLSLTSILFLIPINSLGPAQKETITSSGYSFLLIRGSLGQYAVNIMNRYLPQSSLIAISEVISSLRSSGAEGKFMIFMLHVSILSSLASIFGAIGKSMGLIKFSIFSFMVSQAFSIFGVFYAPTLGKLHGLQFLSNPVVLLTTLTVVIFYTMWYSHLLYSFYKVLRAGGNGGEYLSYREIIDRRNFLRWKTWKERELERGSPYNPSFSRSSEKDRLLKSSR
ncbi:membrane protein [Cryptosporidium canis]|nr:membrane protein [Cryptosporidium canis]